MRQAGGSAYGKHSLPSPASGLRQDIPGQPLRLCPGLSPPVLSCPQARGGSAQHGWRCARWRPPAPQRTVISAALAGPAADGKLDSLSRPPVFSFPSTYLKKKKNHKKVLSNPFLFKTVWRQSPSPERRPSRASERGTTVAATASLPPKKMLQHLLPCRRGLGVAEGM